MHSRWCLFVASFVLLPGVASAADVLESLDLRQVHVDGEIGRRIDVTLHNNLLGAQRRKGFPRALPAAEGQGRLYRPGQPDHAAVRLAAYSRDPQAIALKNRLVAETIQLQEADGYLGMLAPGADVGPVGRPRDRLHRQRAADRLPLFRPAGSLTAAQGGRLHSCPLGHDARRLGPETQVATHVSVTGLERTLLSLFQATGDRRYLDFCLHQRAAGVEPGNRRGAAPTDRRTRLRLHGPLSGAVGAVSPRAGRIVAGSHAAGDRLHDRRQRDGDHRRGRAMGTGLPTRTFAATWARPAPRPTSFAFTTACCAWKAIRVTAT